MAVKIGTAWVQIKPSLDGVQHSINKQLQGTGTSASKNIGKEIGKDAAIGAAVGTAVMNGVIAISSKVAGAVREMFGGALDEMDAVIRSSNAMAQMGYDTGEVAKKIEQLRTNANKTAATMGDLTDGFLNLTASWKDMDLTADATQALSDAILSFGGTPDMVANAITQISQTDLDGPLDAQTWLSLRNSGLIPALGTLARMNNMSLGDFKRALGQGVLTTRDLVEGLIELDQQGTDTQASFEKIAQSNAAATWAGSWDTAKNTVISAISQQAAKLWELKGGGQAIVNMGDSIAKSIETAGGKIQDFIGWCKNGGPEVDALAASIAGLSTALGVMAVSNLAPTAAGGISKLAKAAAGFVKNGHPVVAAIAGIMVALGLFFTKTETGQKLLADFGEWFNSTMLPKLKEFAAFIQAKVVPVLQDIGVVVGKIIEWFSKLITKVAEFVGWIGEKISPVIQWISQKIGELFQKGQEGINSFLQSPFAAMLGSILHLIGSIFKLVVSIAKAVIAFVTPIVKLIAKIVGAIFKVVGAIVKLIATALSPLFSIIKVIVGFIALGATFVVSIVTKIVTFITKMVTTIVNIITTIQNFIYGVVFAIVERITNGIAGVINFISNIILGIVTFITNIVDAIVQAITFGIDIMSAIWTGLCELVADGWNKYVAPIVNKVAEWFQGIIDKVKEWAGKVKDKFNEIWQGIKDSFSGAWELGKDIVEGLVKGITDKVTWVKDQISNFCESALDAIKDFFGIHSPSRVMMEIGGYLDKGLVKGIEKEASTVSDAMESMGKDALGVMSGLDSDFALGVNRSLDVAIRPDELAARGTVIQNNNITISDDFDLKLAQSRLAYAVSQA